MSHIMLDLHVTLVACLEKTTFNAPNTVLGSGDSITIMVLFLALLVKVLKLKAFEKRWPCKVIRMVDVMVIIKPLEVVS